MRVSVLCGSFGVNVMVMEDRLALVEKQIKNLAECSSLSVRLDSSHPVMAQRRRYSCTGELSPSGGLCYL